MKHNKQRLFEVMGRLDKTFKPDLNEGDAFNDAGEPMMTHSQFRDYSEPAEPDYDADRDIPQQNKGIGNFNDIDWRTLHGIFVQNTQAFDQGKFSETVTVNNLTDYDGYLTPDELKHLDAWSLVYIDVDGKSVSIDDEQYMNYDTFLRKALDIWDKDPPYESSQNDSEAPYMRGYEPMSEEIENVAHENFMKVVSFLRNEIYPTLSGNDQAELNAELLKWLT